jgi:hypothetical protein
MACNLTLAAEGTKRSRLAAKKCISAKLGIMFFVSLKLMIICIEYINRLGTGFNTEISHKFYATAHSDIQGVPKVRLDV